MRLDGLWHLSDDGITRPIIRGEVANGKGGWVHVPFLIDTGADRTALSADILAPFEGANLRPGPTLGGIGGEAVTMTVLGPIRFARDDGGEAVFHGDFAAFTDLAALDMSVLGRDILNLLALIVDRSRNLVCLLAPNHAYTIKQS